MTRISSFIICCLLLANCTGETSGKTELSSPKTKKTSTTTQKNKPAGTFNKNAPLSAPEELVSNKDRAIAYLEALESGDKGVIAKIINTRGVNFDHDLFSGDASDYKKFNIEQREQNLSIDVLRAAQQGNFVFTHSLYTMDVPKAGITLFQFDKGQIVNVTGALQSIMGNNESGHGPLSGPTAIENINKTGLNSKIIKDYVSQVLIEGMSDELKRFVNTDYIEHSKYAMDGIDGLSKNNKIREENGKELFHNKLESFYGEGNFVLSICLGKENAEPVKIYDLFRLEDNRISEHWEIISPI